MASKSMNKAVDALARRHAAERAALKAAAEAGAVVRRVQERRVAEVARLDEVVAEAERGADVALAVLASLMAADVAAVLSEETPARVRLAQQRAPGDEVGERVQVLTGGPPAVRRRGRPPGSGTARLGRGGVRLPALGAESSGSPSGEVGGGSDGAARGAGVLHARGEGTVE